MKTRYIIEALSLMFCSKMLVLDPKFVTESAWYRSLRNGTVMLEVIAVKSTPTKRKLLAETYGMSKSFERIILDEASSFKNPSSKKVSGR